MKIKTMSVEIPVQIDLRFYHGWTETFNTQTEKFSSALLCLFNFSSSTDLELAIDRAIQYREKGN